MTAMSNETPSGTLDPIIDKRPPRSRPWFLNPLVITGIAVFLVWVVIALTWRLWVQDPYATNQLDSLKAPSPEHLFGTDSLGRDVFARVMAGSQTVLLVAPAATFLTMILGVTIGAIAGYAGGVVDNVLMRIMDFVLAFPGLIIAIIVLALFRSDMVTLILVLAIFFTPLTARVVRGAAHNLRNAEFVDAARMRGDGTARIIFTEILPNIVPTIAVEATVRLSSAIVTSASLSFLGLGIIPPTADWGLMISTEANFMSFAWWSAVFPALALGSLVMSVAITAEGMRRGLDR